MTGLTGREEVCEEGFVGIKWAGDVGEKGKPGGRAAVCEFLGFPYQVLVGCVEELFPVGGPGFSHSSVV